MDPSAWPPPRPAVRASSFTWALGLLCLAGLAVITLNTLRTDAPGSRGVEPGSPLPPFAVLLATSDRSCGGRICDANVAARAGEGARTPACRVRLPEVMSSCRLAERGPVALAFVATRSERCEAQVDVMERIRARHPRVQFAAVAVRGDRDGLRATIRERGWRLPVGFDHNGAVANLYAVAVCPTITFARQGGRVASTSFELLDERAVARRLQAIGG